MDIETLYTIGTFVSGIFDFITCVAVIGVALTVVRRADATSGYVLGGAMGLNFLSSCCMRALHQVPSEGEGMGMAVAGLGVIRPFFGLVLWGAVIFVLVQLARLVPVRGA